MATTRDGAVRRADTPDFSDTRQRVVSAAPPPGSQNAADENPVAAPIACVGRTRKERFTVSSRVSDIQEGIMGVIEDVKGKVKEIIGIVIEHDDLRREGRAQQDKARAQRDAAKREAQAESARGAAKANEKRQAAKQAKQ